MKKIELIIFLIFGLVKIWVSVMIQVLKKVTIFIERNCDQHK